MLLTCISCVSMNWEIKGAEVKHEEGGLQEDHVRARGSKSDVTLQLGAQEAHDWQVQRHAYLHGVPKPVWVSRWCVVWEFAADIKWAGIISAQKVLIVHGSVNSVHTLTTSLNCSLETTVLANVLLLKNLLRICLNDPYVTRWRYPADDGGAWLRSALAADEENRRKLPETLRRLECHFEHLLERRSLQIMTRIVLQIKWPTMCARTMYNVQRCSSIQICTKCLFKTHFQMTTL